MTWSVTHGSLNTRSGAEGCTGSSQLMTSFETRPATAVPVTGLDSDAIWNTVSAETASVVPTSRTPYPSANTTSSSYTTATATPGTPVPFISSCTNPSIEVNPASTCSRVTASVTAPRLPAPPAYSASSGLVVGAVVTSASVESGASAAVVASLAVSSSSELHATTTSTAPSASAVIRRRTMIPPS